MFFLYTVCKKRFITVNRYAVSFVFKNKFSLLCGYTFGFFPFIFSAASPFIFLADLVCTYSDYQLYIITRIKLQPFINCIFKGQTFIFKTIINLRYYIIAVSFLTTPFFYICIKNVTIWINVSLGTYSENYIGIYVFYSIINAFNQIINIFSCLLYTSDAADEL